jgi:AAA+ ATPase superfamily predicted ATPase
MNPFIGRKEEFQKLAELRERHGGSLVVVKGRRRVGKSRFITEFANVYKGKNRFFSFTGLAPAKEITLQVQLNHFGKQVSLYLNMPSVTFNDWTDAFNYLAHHTTTGDIILFDEISWMGAHDPAFVSKLKAWWDLTISKIDHVLLIFCGSVSTWIEENILSSTAFFGRVPLVLTLNPLSIPESAALLKSVGFKGSPFEFYKLLSVFGGIPWYLEHVNPREMADKNIKNLCFKKDGLLVNEFDRIFNDLFNGRGAAYKKILESLKEGIKTLAEVREAIAYSHSGTLSSMMDHLIISGFVQKHQQWSLKTETPLKQSLYRICDPYTRFYLKIIEPNKARINQGSYHDLELDQIPGFDSHVGLQVEYLLIQNRALLLKKIGISASECVADGPYRQTKTVQTKGCQIDYLVQTRTRNLFLCEFKFKRWEIGLEIIEEMQTKMNRLSIPRGFAVVPVIFHIGGMSEVIYEKNFFYKTIDISDFLNIG